MLEKSGVGVTTSFFAYENIRIHLRIDYFQVIRNKRIKHNIK